MLLEFNKAFMKCEEIYVTRAAVGVFFSNGATVSPLKNLLPLFTIRKCLGCSTAILSGG